MKLRMTSAIHLSRPEPSLTTQPNDPRPVDVPSDVAELQALVARLLQENAHLKRMLFGRRSERLIDDPNQQQLFGDAPAPVEATPPDDDQPGPKPGCLIM